MEPLLLCDLFRKRPVVVWRRVKDGYYNHPSCHYVAYHYV